MDGDSRLVSALARGITILRCFSPTAQELSAKELADLTGLPKPTLFRLVDTLCELGLMRYSERVSKYVPGVGLLNLAAPVLARMTIRQLARPMMEDLANHVRGQVQLAAGHGLNLSYVELVQGHDSKVFRPEVGMHLSLSRTASGRAYLSALPAGEREAYLTELQAADADRAAWLRQRLDNARQDLAQHGFCRSHADLHREIESIAVPMNNPREEERWVFAVSVPVFSEQSKQLETDVGPRLVSLVRSMEAALGNLA